MFEAQIGPQIKQMNPIPVFNKTLTRVDLVNFHDNPEKVKNHFMPPDLRENFDIFFRHFIDSASRAIAKRVLLPDLPPDSYFEHPPDHQTPPPTALHDLTTGLLMPHFLAFLCGQALSQQEEMLIPV